MAPPSDLSPELIKEFVIAAHFDLAKVQSMLAQQPALLNVRHQWAENDFESSLDAAAHMGSRPIAEFLLDQGAPLDICAAAMLGRKDDVARYLNADPAQANAKGAHGIPLAYHLAMSGDTELAQMVYDAGGRNGLDFALHGAVAFGHLEMARWLIEHGADDLNVKDFRQRTPLGVAVELGHTAIADLLRSRGAVE